VNSTQPALVPRPFGDGAPAYVVVLGASNVTLGFPRIVRAIQSMFPGPVQILAAHGHGRSYGQKSWIPFRTLPAIRHCGLWDALDRLRAVSEPIPPLYALVTDIGNDLVFGNPPERIAGWVEDCLNRLLERDARITVGRLPLSSLQRIGKFRFRATRRLFFPGSSLTYERVQVDAPHLDELVAGLASRLGLASFVPRPEWYGFDPIHIRRAHRGSAWQEVFSLWGGPPGGPAVSPGVRAHWRYWNLQPAERRVLGREKIRAQPGWTGTNGAGIWLF
jgi:hypothetical protein